MSESVTFKKSKFVMVRVVLRKVLGQTSHLGVVPSLSHVIGRGYCSASSNQDGFQVIVVGGGHAGTEAAAASAR